MKITIAHLYPDLLNLYGDQGNIECLTQRCLWRGIEVEIVPITVNDQSSILNPHGGETYLKSSIIFMGGGEDVSQKELYNDFINNKGEFVRQYIEAGGVGLFICGGLQLLGKYYRPYAGADILGLNILDLYTQHFGRDKARCVGNVSCKITGIEYLQNKTLVGFENHGGKTFLNYENTKNNFNSIRPLGEVITGFGNNGEDKTEGVVYKNTIGTYLHGPLLPKNPHLTDWLIKTALENKYKKEVELKSINDDLEWETHKQVMGRE